MSNPGDGVSKFPVTAWFDNGNIPNGFPTPSTDWSGYWTYNGKTITIDYQKAD
jgi:hypothetical protein